MATLHFICGKPGSGKTTLARELGRTVPALVICEDEWLATLQFDIKSVADYRDASAKCRNLIATMVPDMLRLGLSVVLDYAANTAERRAWVRTLYEAAGADHLLHCLEGSDAACLDNVHRRNDEKPPGVYFGAVSDELFHAITPYFVAPADDEGFHVVRRPVHAPPQASVRP